MDVLAIIFIGTLNGVFLGLFIYFSKVSNIDATTLFNPDKLLRISVVAFLLSLVASYMDYRLTIDNWQSYMSANTGLIVIGDQLIKMIWRLIANLKGRM